MEIKITNLTKKYKDIVAVNGVSLDISDNQIFCMLGTNGAGKTTFIKMLSGIIKKDCGSVFYGDFNIDNDLDKIKNFINVSPQETAVCENLTVRENILFIAEIYGVLKGELNKRVDEVIALFSLGDVQNKKAKLLSGGTKRRLSIAMAIVTKPKVLFLDEPTLGLDVISKRSLHKLILSLKKDMTIILTTHYMEEAETLADNVAIISSGKIIKVDTPNNLITKGGYKNLEQAFIDIVESVK